MLMVMKEMFMASIVTTAGKKQLFSVLWLRCLFVQAFIPQGDSFLVQIVVLVQRFVGSLLAGERPTHGHVGHIEEINDTMLIL